MGSTNGVVIDRQGKAAPRPNDEPVLSVDALSVHFAVEGGMLKAVDEISFDLRAGETLGIVGESGSGKTVSSLAILRLLGGPRVRMPSGRIVFDGKDLMRLSENELADIRGRSIAMIFQEPMSALNPVRTVGNQVDETLIRHLGLGAAAARKRTVELFGLCGIPSPGRNADNYPHQLSGGMRQRVMIAMALACEPSVIIADEPTTALDVTIQAQILDLLVSLQDRLGTSIVLITHDLAVIAETAHRVAVMYAGRIVELAPVGAIFAAPRHPYTQGLLRSIPRISRVRETMLAEIAGTVPSLVNPGPGCAFADRCALADATCRQSRPPLAAVGDGHQAACWKAGHA